MKQRDSSDRTDNAHPGLPRTILRIQEPRGAIPCRSCQCNAKMDGVPKHLYELVILEANDTIIACHSCVIVEGANESRSLESTITANEIRASHSRVWTLTVRPHRPCTNGTGYGSGSDASWISGMPQTVRATASVDMSSVLVRILCYSGCVHGVYCGTVIVLQHGQCSGSTCSYQKSLLRIGSQATTDVGWLRS